MFAKFCYDEDVGGLSDCLVFVSVRTRRLPGTDQANDSEWCHANFSNYSTDTRLGLTCFISQTETPDQAI